MHKNGFWIILQLLFLLVLETVGDGCGKAITALHGQFSTPDYPGVYPNDLNCKWNITVPVGYYLMLNFTQFELEWVDLCAYDYVIVKSKNGTHGKYCGRRVDVIESTKQKVEQTKEEVPPRKPLFVYDSYLEVEFHTDFSNEVEVHGFLAHFAAIDINECLLKNGGCNHFCHNFIGGFSCSCRIGYRLDKDKKTCVVQCQKMHLQKEKGFLESPEYPMNYPPQAQCDWHITAEKGYYVNLKFLDFHIEDHHDSLCPYDKLLIEDEKTKMGPFCGKIPPSPYRSASNWLIVEFFSDVSQGAKGFRAEYWLEANKCPELEAPEFGYMTGPKNFTFKFKETFKFGCQAGYEYIKGDKERTCQADGTWTGKTGTCDQITCPEPISYNSNIGITSPRGADRHFNSSVDVDCSLFYDRIGSDKMYCQANRTWSNMDTYCLKTCGKSLKTYPTIQECKNGRFRALSRRMFQPWLVAIKEDGKLICSGVLINQEWILTAGHCLADAKERYGEIDKLEVVLGAFYWDQLVDDETEVRKIKRAVFRKKFDYGIHSDIILAQLDRPVKTDYKYIQPICLPHEKKQRHMFGGGRNVATIGWYREGPKYMTDRCVQLTSKPTCLKHVRETHLRIHKERYKSENSRSNHIPTDILCTNATRGDSDLCNIHPGSPLVAYDKETRKWYLGGIYTWGSKDVKYCKQFMNKFDMFAKVNKYTKWIRSVTSINLKNPDSEKHHGAKR